MAQLVKNPPVKREIWIQSLGWVDPLEKGTATHSNILAWRIPWTVYKVPDLRVLDDSKSRQKSSLWKKGGLSVSFNRLQPMSSRKGDQEEKI